MENIATLLQYVLHIDTYLLNFVSAYGLWTYVVLFLIVFCETGLVVTPFLPGDSLIFAAGGIAAHPDAELSIQLLFFLLLIASILGNKMNYFIGRAVGPRVFHAETSWLLNKKHLTEANRYYEKHGAMTIIFARFIPIIRTFAPFVAGVADMSMSRFTLFNIVSAFLWIGSLLALGYFFGSLPFMQAHFSLVVYSIIGLSLLPPLIAFIYQKIRSR